MNVVIPKELFDKIVNSFTSLVDQEPDDSECVNEMNNILIDLKKCHPYEADS